MSEDTQASSNMYAPSLNGQFIGGCIQITMPVPDEFIKCIITYIGMGCVRIVIPPYEVLNALDEYTSDLLDPPTKRIKTE